MAQNVYYVNGVAVSSGLAANLPSSAAEIASALGIQLSQVTPGLLFFTTDTGVLYVWNGSIMVATHGSSGVTWGSITGTLTNQTDLQSALNSINSAVSAETSRAETAEALLVRQTTTVNGHALTTNIVVSASDITTGTLPHAQLPALLSGDIPNNAANTSGNAATASAVAWSGLSAPSANLTLSCAGYSTTINQTSAVDWLWANVTAATGSTAGQSSPILQLQGQAYVSGTSTPSTYSIQNVVSSTNASESTLTFTHSGSDISLGYSFSGTIATTSGSIMSAGNVTAAASSAINWNGRSQMFSPSSGIIELANSGGTAFTRLNFGGTTSSFVALQSSGTTLTVGTSDGGTAAGALIVSGLLNAVTGLEVNSSLAINGSGVVTSIGGNATVGNVGCPGVMFTSTVTGQSSVISPTTVYTTPQGGYYRISGYVWPTTASSSAWTLDIGAVVMPNGGIANVTQVLMGMNMETGAVTSNPADGLVYLASGATIKVETVTASGSNTGGVYSYSFVVELVA